MVDVNVTANNHVEMVNVSINTQSNKIDDCVLAEFDLSFLDNLGTGLCSGGGSSGTNQTT